MLNYRKQILLVLILIYSTIGFSQIRFNKTYDFVDTDSNRYNNIGLDFIELSDSTYLMTRMSTNENVFDTLNFAKSYFIVSKVDKYGNTIDSNNYNIKGKDIACNSLVRTNQGKNFLIGWIIDYKKYLDSNLLYDVFCARLNNHGDTLWTNSYSFGKGNEFINKVITTDDGNIIIFGTSCTQDRNDCNAYILKLDTNGNVLIKQKYTYTSTSVEYAGGIQIKDNNIYLLATSNGDTSGIKAEIFKINRLGQLMSVHRLPYISNLTDEYFTEDLLIDKDGNFLVVGQAYYDKSAIYVGEIAKLDSNYNILWKQTINNTVGSDYISVMGFNNNYYVVGNRLNTKNDFANPYVTSFSKNGTLRFDRKINFSSSILESGLVYNLKLTRDTGLAFIGYSEFEDTVYNQFTWFFKTDTLGCFVDGCTFTGIDMKANVNNITVYPNPASEKLFMYGAEGREIEVIDLNGRSILKTIYDFYGIDLTSLPPALYTIKINVENQFVYRKFVKY